MAEAMHDATALLSRYGTGDIAAAEALTPLMYDQLRAMAGAFLAEERVGHTLQPTALVHEAYVRLIDQRKVSKDDRAAFMGLAAAIMRRVLVDHARARARLKRGGDAQRVALTDDLAIDPGEARQFDAEIFEDALVSLEGLDARKARLVELRVFCGVPETEAASLLGISRATASREWRLARSWIQREIDRSDEQ